MIRVDGWEARLMSAMQDHAAQSYAWGSSDCVAMARASVQAVTGEDLKIPRYTSELGAAKALRKLGVDRLGDAAGLFLKERARGLEQRGDIAVIETQAGDTLAVVMGAQVLWKSADGGRFFPLSHARVTYAVG